MIHYMVVKNRVMLSASPICVSNNAGYDMVQPIFDSEWDGLDVVIVMGVVKFKWTGEPVVVPQSVMSEPGPIPVTFVGYKGDERLVTARSDDALIAVESGDYDGGDPYPEQPDLLKQLMDAADRANDAAEKAEGIVGSQSDYNYLQNLPTINGVKIRGDAPDLGTYGASSIGDDDIQAICV